MSIICVPHIDFDLIVRADINNIENRVFFSSPGMPTASETVTANIGQQLCRSQTAYIEVSAVG